jgi:uncharacterized protein YbaP (TraB family)
MNNKFLILVFIFILKSFTFFKAQLVVSNHQLLWQITGNGLKKPSYLFGSYHSNDSRVFKLSDSTYAAIYNAEAIVLEADIYQLFAQYDMRLKSANLKFDFYGKPYTSNNKASLTKYGNEDGRPQFLDLYFQQLAYNMNKEFYPLETIEEQLEAFESVYERTATQKNLQQMKILQDKLLNAYLKGDIEQVKTIIQSQLSDSKNAYERLIVNRNQVMVVGIDSLIRKKSMFVAVGCGHLGGNEGLISLLRKKGYHLREVVASYSEPKTEIQKKIISFNKFNYSNEKYGFKAVFGGKPIRDSSVNYFRLIYQEMGQGNSYVIEIENLINENFTDYAEDVIDLPDGSKMTELKHQETILAYEAIGYDYIGGLSWKRVFVVNNKLVKLICYGGNKFMNSNRPQNFFNQVVFE